MYLCSSPAGVDDPASRKTVNSPAAPARPTNDAKCHAKSKVSPRTDALLVRLSVVKTLFSLSWCFSEMKLHRAKNKHKSTSSSMNVTKLNSCWPEARVQLPFDPRLPRPVISHSQQQVGVWSPSSDRLTLSLRFTQTSCQKEMKARRSQPLQTDRLELKRAAGFYGAATAPQQLGPGCNFHLSTKKEE